MLYDHMEWRIENKRKKMLDWRTGVEGTGQWLRYSQSSNINQEFLRYEAFASLRATLRKHWKVEVKPSYRQYLPTSFSGRSEFVFVHATVSRYFKDKALRVYVRGINLLDETDRVERNAFATQFSEQWTNRLGRVVLLGVQWKIRQFGK